MPSRFLAALLALAPTVAQAGSTDWVDHDFARSRLVTATDSVTPATDTLLLGWEIELDRGWKTYWRSPGEAGLPVELRLAQGDNVEALDVVFPYPERFSFYGIETYGYGKRVILPVKVTPMRTDKDVVLTVAADFQICEEICIPISTNYEIDIPAADRALKSPHGVAVSEYLEQVPDAEGGDGVGLDIDYLSVRGPAGRQRMTVDIVSDAPIKQGDVIVEADARFTFDSPRYALNADRKSARFVFRVGGVEPGADLKGETIVLTVSDGAGHSIERTRTID